MNERVATRPGGPDRALGAEMLLVALVVGYGANSLPRVVLLLPLASMSVWMRGLRWADLGLRRPPAVRRTVAAAVAAALGILLAVRLAILPLAV